MTPFGTSENGLRTVYQLGGDWFWFFLAVITGLLLAAWATGLAVDALPIAPDPRG
jgi:hypothetical protein